LKRILRKQVTTARRHMDRRRRDPDGYPPGLQPVPRVAVTLEEAAASIGVSLAHFRRHVLPELHTIRSGATRLVPVVELSRWAERAATLAGSTDRGRQ
jgi:hypothetical protein